MKNIMMITMLFLSITYAVTTSTEVVVDSKTKLEWQNEAVNKTESKSWEDAIAYCESLNLDEKTDWRLPNINELKSLIDYETDFNLAIISTLKLTTNDHPYWSSTTSPIDSTKVFEIYFSLGGRSHPSDKDTTKNFRCVRDY